MNTHTKVDTQSAQQLTQPGNNGSNDAIATTSAPARVNGSQQTVTSNTVLTSRQIDHEAFKSAAQTGHFSEQTINNIKEIVQKLPDLNQLQEGQIVAGNPIMGEATWELIMKNGVLLLFFILMKMEIMMPVYKNQ